MVNPISNEIPIDINKNPMKAHENPMAIPSNSHDVPIFCPIKPTKSHEIPISSWLTHEKIWKKKHEKTIDLLPKKRDEPLDHYSLQRSPQRMPAVIVTGTFTIVRWLYFGDFMDFTKSSSTTRDQKNMWLFGHWNTVKTAKNIQEPGFNHRFVATMNLNLLSMGVLQSLE